MRIKRTQEIGRVPASLYSSLILQEGCTKVPEQVLNSKVLSLVDLHRVSKVARVNFLVSLLEREILIWLLLAETFESLWMGSLQLTTPHRKWLTSE